jgi:hypothetical protein
MWFELAALVSAGLFAGAALYINLVEHPARLSCGVPLALAEFKPSYHRAAAMQASLAAIGLLSGLAAWLAGSGLGWLIGGVLLGSVIPLTLVVIFPTNKQLLDPALDANSAQAATLLARWNRLHAIRSVLGLAAFVTFAWLAVQR